MLMIQRKAPSRDDSALFQYDAYSLTGNHTDAFGM